MVISPLLNIVFREHFYCATDHPWDVSQLNSNCWSISFPFSIYSEAWNKKFAGTKNLTNCNLPNKESHKTPSKTPSHTFPLLISANALHAPAYSECPIELQLRLFCPDFKFYLISPSDPLVNNNQISAKAGY